MMKLSEKPKQMVRTICKTIKTNEMNVFTQYTVR